MRARGLFLWIVIAAGVVVVAISGEEPPVSLFVLPKVELRKEVVAPGETVGEAEGVREGEAVEERAGADDVSKKEELSVTTEGAVAISEISIQVYESMNGGPVLGRMEMPHEPGGAIGWLQTEVWDPVFAPEVVKVGKVQMSGSIVTAIKRKNPFCLLHPLAFVASW
jgi:hypothetical protein